MNRCNRSERAILLADGDIILPEHLPKACQQFGAELQLFDDNEIISLEENEHRYLLRVLATYPDDCKTLAKRPDVSKRTLYRKLQVLQEDKS